ncbi:MAG: hypothetical protein ACK4ZX_10925, partial [Thermus sp.]
MVDRTQSLGLRLRGAVAVAVATVLPAARRCTVVAVAAGPPLVAARHCTVAQAVTAAVVGVDRRGRRRVAAAAALWV